MTKVRIFGPRDRLDRAVSVIQDLGLLHLGNASQVPGLSPPAPDERGGRRRRFAQRTLEDVEEALRLLDANGRPAGAMALDESQLVAWGRFARRTVREARRLDERARQLEEERRLLERYRDFLAVVRPILERLATTPRLTSYAVIVPAASHGVLDQLLSRLRAEVGPEFASAARTLPGGDTAVLLVLPQEFAERLEERLAEARVPEIALPASLRGRPLSDAVPEMVRRLHRIPVDVAQVAREQRRLAESVGPELRRARGAVRDWLSRVDAEAHCGLTPRAFAIEGWLPTSAVPRLRSSLASHVGGATVVEELDRESWRAEEAPVVLSNPRLFRPFESIVGIMPLPRYGTIDPTPYVAVVFPMMFGMIIGDIGYGLLLAVLGLVLHARARPGSLLRTIAEIAGPCAAFAIVFGALYGEFFGDLGRRWFGMHALLFDREESLVAALAVTAGLGLAHVFLGLIVGTVSAARHEPRHALGRGLSALMLALVAVTLLAAIEVLPRALFTPLVITLLVAFPILVFVEGLLAPIDFLTTLGSVLSYTRIMALGTASVMLAVVANRMVGALGSTLVGLVFALLFHLVNFTIGLFSPSIQAMRLHFVEFFGKFYSPGGRRYEPFAHWRPRTGG